LYKCPQCSEKFTREGNEEVPLCPEHLKPLVPVRP
jgi:DNA-directed RNA polymerase subunit RPC12/RpoP